MKKEWTITGKIVSGVGQGAFFTQLVWFQSQCRDKLGFEPFPGTLNLEISLDDVKRIESFEQEADIEFVPPDSEFCSGKAFQVVVEGVPAAVVIPAAEVRVHGKNIIEVISDRRLKDALNVDDGDSVTLTAVAK